LIVPLEVITQEPIGVMESVFDYDSERQLVVVNNATVPVILVGEDRTPYFRCNDAARVLGYGNVKKVVTKHVRPQQITTLADLLQEGVPILGTPCEPNANDLDSRYMRESGLYRLISRSKLPLAEAFQDWVEDEVLPAIRKSGSYSIKGPNEARGSSVVDWSKKRLEGKDLSKLKNAALKELIQGAFGTSGAKLYPIVNNQINQSVIGFKQTTTQYKKLKQMPGRMSVPDFLSMDGQVARCIEETAFKKFILENLAALRLGPEKEVIGKFDILGNKLRDSFVSIGMGDLENGMLSIQQAKTRKRKLEVAHKKSLCGATGSALGTLSLATSCC